MIRFDCDWCRRTKTAGETWILGLAAEAVGITAARREITIVPRWSRETAVHPLAVHFCSEECKDDYMAQLFQNRPASTHDVTIERKPARKARLKRGKSSSSRTKHRVQRTKRAA
jgi:hypothetical protein